VQSHTPDKYDQLREIQEIDECPECGWTWLTVNNKANHKAWAICWNCEAEIPLEFAEPYKGSKHKRFAMLGETSAYKGGRRI
jgi:hypothetical protein